MATKTKAKKVKTPPKQRWFKVLVGGKSCHGGTLEWSLPKGKKPGAWHEVEGDLRICSNGLHLTSDPTRWWKNGAECFEVEYDGEATAPDEDGAKIAVRRCRLISRVEETDLAEMGVFLSGTHEVKTGNAVACGSSTVKAYGSSTVTAYGSSTVKAYGSSTVKACDSSTVKAYGSSTVKACDSSTVTAYDSSTVQSMWGMPSVQVEHYAVSIDRRVTPPVITTAKKAS